MSTVQSNPSFLIELFNKKRYKDIWFISLPKVFFFVFNCTVLKVRKNVPVSKGKVSTRYHGMSV